MSLFQMHNETINVWTHLLGFIACLVAFCIMSFAKVIDDETQFSENARQLLYLIQGGQAPQGDEGSVPSLASFDTGYIESQKAEFHVFMATME